MSVNKILLLFLSVSCSVAAGWSQSSTLVLGNYFSASYADHAINGNVLVSDNGKTVFEKSYGMADFENKRPNEASTVFQWASITKIFTATAVLKLMEEGKLGLDDKLVKYFPDFPFPDINIRHLLSNTSGLPDFELFEQTVRQHPDKVVTNADIIPEYIRQKSKLKFTPGAKLLYCNFNFNLLTMLVEKISGMNYGAFLKKNIFTPAGMNTYEKNLFTNAKRSPDEAFYYDYLYLFSDKLTRIEDAFFLERFKNAYYNLEGLMGEGSLYGTTQDLSAFDKALYAGKILKQQTLDLAFTPVKLNDGTYGTMNVGFGDSYYCLGWELLKDTSMGKVVWHTGGRYGCQTLFMRNISKKQVVTVLDNGESEGLYRTAANAMLLLNNRPPILYRKSIVKIYGRDLVGKDEDHAYSHLAVLLLDSTHFRLRETEMNELGYQLMANHFTKQGLETFKLVTLLFPGSFNAFDSYGEWLAVLGRKEEALMMYRKSVVLNPDSQGGKDAIEQLLKK